MSQRRDRRDLDLKTIDAQRQLDQPLLVHDVENPRHDRDHGLVNQAPECGAQIGGELTGAFCNLSCRARRHVVGRQRVVHQNLFDVHAQIIHHDLRHVEIAGARQRRQAWALRATVAGDRDDRARFDLHVLRIQNAIVSGSVDARDSDRCVLQHQLDGLVERLDISDRSDQRPTTVDFASNLHVARHDERVGAHRAIDQLLLLGRPDHMVAVDTAFHVEDHRIDQINVLGRRVVDDILQLRRDLSIRELLRDNLGLEAQLAIDVIDVAERTLFDRNQVLRDRGEADRRDLITRRNHHHGSAHAEIQKEFAQRQVKVSLAQRLEHNCGILVQCALRGRLVLSRDRGSSFQAAPSFIGREQTRLDAVGKTLRCMDRCRVKHAAHLCLTGNTTLVVTRIQIALRQSELIAVLVYRAPFVLARLSLGFALHDLLYVKLSHRLLPSIVVKCCAISRERLPCWKHPRHGGTATGGWVSPCCRAPARGSPPCARGRRRGEDCRPT